MNFFISYNIMIILLIVFLLIITFRLKKEKTDKKKSQEHIKFLTSEVSTYKKRTENLEDKIEHDFGVQVRNIINEIKVDFTKIEMVMMISGINKLIKDSANIDDLKIYIALYEKLQDALNKMTEERENKNGI